MPEDVKDKVGEPLNPDCFVRVERANHLAPGHTYQRHGLVLSVTFDAKGALIELREWRAGRYNGKKLIVRADHCTVVRAPEALREQQAREAQTLMRVKLREEEEDRQKRLKALQKERAKEGTE